MHSQVNASGGRDGEEKETRKISAGAYLSVIWSLVHIVKGSRVLIDVW